MDNKTIEVKKTDTKVYKIVIAILIAIIIFLLFRLNNASTVISEVKAEKEEIRIDLTGELDSLMGEYDVAKKEYGELSEQVVEKDSIILAHAEEIKRLISKTSDYNRIKRKLNYLRSIQQSYIDQLDSLYTVNRQLSEDLNVANEQINIKDQETKVLKKEKQELEVLVEKSSKLKAYNVKGLTYALRGKSDKEIETYKARRVDRVKIKFTIGENPIVTHGEKTVYVRLARPDGIIVSKSKTDEFSFLNSDGTRLQYSLKEDFEYSGKSMDFVLNWDKVYDSPAAEGSYHIGIYCDGEMIGQGGFTID